MTTDTPTPRLATIVGALAVAVLAGVPSTAAAATGPTVPPPRPRPPARTSPGHLAVVPTRLQLRADRDDSGVTLRVR
jgi:hypothetical protein